MNLKSILLPLFVALILAFNIKLNAAEFIIENDTINKNYFDSLSYKTYSSPGGGYVSGNNAYNDRAKAQEFHAGNPCNIYGVLINFGFKNFHLHFGYFGPPQSPDEFFCFAGKHAAAHDFNPAGALPFEMWFEKHRLLRFRM